MFSSLFTLFFSDSRVFLTISSKTKSRRHLSVVLVIRFNIYLERYKIQGIALRRFCVATYLSVLFQIFVTGERPSAIFFLDIFFLNHHLHWVVNYKCYSVVYYFQTHKIIFQFKTICTIKPLSCRIFTINHHNFCFTECDCELVCAIFTINTFQNADEFFIARNCN